MARHPPTLPAEPQRSQPPGVAAFDTESTLEVSDRAPRATDEARKQLFERLEKTPVAMTVSTDADGGIRVRPLMTQKGGRAVTPPLSRPGPSFWTMKGLSV